jgi:hypothetical protein
VQINETVVAVWCETPIKGKCSKPELMQVARTGALPLNPSFLHYATSAAFECAPPPLNTPHAMLPHEREQPTCPCFMHLPQLSVPSQQEQGAKPRADRGADAAARVQESRRLWVEGAAARVAGPVEALPVGAGGQTFPGGPAQRARTVGARGHAQGEREREGAGAARWAERVTERAEKTA